MSASELLRRAMSDMSAGNGWASRMLYESLRRSTLLAVCVWQLVMLWAKQVIAHTNLYWKYQSAPGKSADVVDADNVAFSTGGARVSKTRQGQ